jgi:hypothetical protein
MNENQDPSVRALLERARRDGARPGQLERIEVNVARTWWLQKWLPWCAGGVGIAGVVLMMAMLSSSPVPEGAEVAEPLPMLAIEPHLSPAAVMPSTEATHDIEVPTVSPELEPARAASASRATELELLTQATNALQTDRRAALAALRAHRHLYPRGAYREERELLLVEVSEGTCEQTRARIARFEEAFPGSIHQARVRRAEARACEE